MKYSNLSETKSKYKNQYFEDSYQEEKPLNLIPKAMEV